jgi:hypothetical protein
MQCAHLVGGQENVVPGAKLAGVPCFGIRKACETCEACALGVVGKSLGEEVGEVLEFLTV